MSTEQVARLRFGLMLAALAAVGYSLKAIFIKLAYPYGVDAVTLLTLRMAFSLPVFLGVALGEWRRVLALTPGDWGRLALMGTLGYYGASILDFWGLQHISAGLERLVLFTYPTLTILIGVLVFGKRLSRNEILAMILCYAGIGLAFAHDLRFGDAQAVVFGSSLVFASSVCYACYLSGSEGMIRRLGARCFTAMAMLVSTLVIFVHFFLSHSPSALLQPLPVLGWTLAMAVFSTVAPVFMLAAAIARIGAGRTALASMLGPLLTIGFGWWLLGEALSFEQIVGAALVIGGILVTGKK